MTARSPALFGIGCTSHAVFADEYRGWQRRRNSRRRNKVEMPSMRYVPARRAKLPPADIYLVETVGVFLTLRTFLPPNSAVVVSDTPLLLSELPHLRSLDWQQDIWRFRLNPVNYNAFETGRLAGQKITDESVWHSTQPAALDRLGLVIDETATGKLLSPINAVQFQLNFLDRVQFRLVLGRYLSEQIDLKGFESAVRALIAQGPTDTQISLMSLTEVVNILKTQGPLYRQAVAALAAKKSPNKFLKDTEITPFEIRYLTRLVKP